MERLTDLEPCKNCDKNGYCQEDCIAKITFNDACVTRLAAYEDTGLEPEDVKELNYQINHLEKTNKQSAHQQNFYERDAYLEALATREALTVRPIILQREEAEKVLGKNERLGKDGRN